MKYLSFCDWIISLSIISSWFIYTVVCEKTSFFLKDEKYSMVYTYMPHFLYLYFIGLLLPLG